MHPQKVCENHIYYCVSNLQPAVALVSYYHQHYQIHIFNSRHESKTNEANLRDPDVFPFPGIWAIWVIGRVATWELMHATWETLLQVMAQYGWRPYSRLSFPQTAQYSYYYPHSTLKYRFFKPRSLIVICSCYHNSPIFDKYQIQST